MKLNIISDLHCLLKEDGSVDWMGFEPEKLEPADYLIVAGDSGYANSERIIHKELRERTKGKFKNVLTIKGNHSYWVFPNDPFNTVADELAMAPNDRIDVVDGNVAIIGTTLWTNTSSFSELMYMNDYRWIPDFKSEVKIERFKEESAWLRTKWLDYKQQGKKVVIVTHHNPRSSREMPEYSREHSDVSTAYWVLKKELDDIKPDLWICGHIHERFDGEIDGVRFVRNPIGYRWGAYALLQDPKVNKNCQKMFDEWYKTVIEV